jgi:hypothetical protein
MRGIDHFVFVLNNDDFDRPSSWASETTHLTYRPWLRSVYLMQRYGLKSSRQPPSHLRVPPRDLRSMFDRFATATNRLITVPLFHHRRDTSDAALWLCPALADRCATPTLVLRRGGFCMNLRIIHGCDPY